MNLWDVIQAGGYVMFALAAMFIGVIAIWVSRYSKLASYEKKDTMMIQQVRDYVVEGDIDNAENVCKMAKTPGSNIVLSGLKMLGREMPEIYSAMHAAEDAEMPLLQKGHRWLRAIAVISPLAGAGGTLAGICGRLSSISLIGATVDLAQISVLISPALVTAIAGFVVGAFSYVAYVCLDGTICKTKHRLSDLTLEFGGLLNEPT